MHRFHLKDTVTLVSRVGSSAAGGGYEVVRLIPPDESGDPQYRIKSIKENHERVVRESQISRF